MSESTTEQQAAPAAAPDAPGAVAPQAAPPVAQPAATDTGAAEAGAQGAQRGMAAEVSRLEAELDAWFERHFSGLVLPLENAARRAHEDLKKILGIL